MMKKLVTFFAERSLIVNLMSIGIVLAGAIFIFSINKEAFPKVEYDFVMITTVYPGATPADIEKHITIPIETELREVEGIEEIWSSSIESNSRIIIQLDPDLSDKDKTILDIKDAVDQVTDFPEEAEEPIVFELASNLVPVIEISIKDTKGVENDADEFELRKVAKRLEDRLRELKGVAQIDKQGYRDREMTVEVNPDLLDKYHVGLNEIINALANKNLNFPGGSIKKNREEIMIRTIGEVETPEEIGKILIRANDFGIPVRIRDVAVVRDTFEEEVITNRTSNKRSVTLTVLKKESADIIKVVDSIEEELKTFRASYSGYYYTTVRSDFTQLSKELAEFINNNGVLFKEIDNTNSGFLTGCSQKKSDTPEVKVFKDELKKFIALSGNAVKGLPSYVNAFIKESDNYKTTNGKIFSESVKKSIDFLKKQDKETDILVKRIKDAADGLSDDDLGRYDKDLPRNVGLLRSVNDDLFTLTSHLEDDLKAFENDSSGLVFFDLFDTVIQLKNKSRYLLTYLDVVQYNIKEKKKKDAPINGKTAKKGQIESGEQTPLQKSLNTSIAKLVFKANQIISQMDRLQIISNEYKQKEREYYDKTVKKFVSETKDTVDIISNSINKMEDVFIEYEIKKSALDSKTVLPLNNDFMKAYTMQKKISASIALRYDSFASEVGRSQGSNNRAYAFETSSDLSYYVRRRLDVLVNNGIVGLILVFLSLFVTLGWRISIVTAIGIPIAFCTTFIWMGQAGITINLISMFGLIIVLGMLVDDAIVVAENIYRYLEEGSPVKEAVINGTAEVITPVAATIMTTIAAFAPLMFMTGIMGKFMWAMPAVVSVALIASWFESMFVLPSHVYDVEKNRKVEVHKEIHEGTIYKRIQNGYEKILRIVLKNKYKFSLLIGVIFFGSLIFAAGNLKFELFPKGNIERFVIKAEAESGVSLEEMSRKLTIIEKLVAELPDTEMENFITRAGILREQPMDPNERIGSHYGTIIVNLTPEENRKRNADEIMDQLRRLSANIKQKEFKKLEFNHLGSGPPVGKAVSVLILGEDFETLKKVTREYEQYLGKIKGLKDIRNDFEEGKKELQIIVDEHVASMAGISVYDVATTVRTCFYGNVATKIKKSEEEIDIRVIFPESYRNNTDSLKRVKIYNQRTQTLVPLSQIAPESKMIHTEGIASINRNSWKRAIQVTAELDDKLHVTSQEINNMLIKDFKNISIKYPGVVVDYKGEFEDTAESMSNLLKSFLIAFIIIYIILVALFKSLGHPFVIISVLPLTAIGVIWAFYFHRLPLSFLAVMGIVGLTGVVINDSIVLVDFIKRKRAMGLDPIEASIQSCRNRLRPVFLTTITTFFGLLPTAYGLGGNDPFLKPMALSMSWGLIFGSAITLIATPLMYNMLTSFRIRITGHIKTASDFAPAHLVKSLEEVEHEIEEELRVDILEKIRSEVCHEVQDQLQSLAETKKSAEKTGKSSAKKTTKKSQKKKTVKKKQS